MGKEPLAGPPRNGPNMSYWQANGASKENANAKDHRDGIMLDVERERRKGHTVVRLWEGGTAK